ncbi:hypothetical protein ONR57_22965 [Hoyosella sp. YIM 151337]|uniref:hypothetical protein n=1 Tax=Hoyosella sp. YIM 151337 TaxID=2992742 RepID=UPI0022362E9B|nr:hypothetical protein [Hoyosella sp. YIM 151337]MCW4356172.1 hypothetical protein [Hoyosella sp. YIM 151337]
MNTYSVRVHETFIHTFTIRAETAEEAEEIATESATGDDWTGATLDVCERDATATRR